MSLRRSDIYAQLRTQNKKVRPGPFLTLIKYTMSFPFSSCFFFKVGQGNREGGGGGKYNQSQLRGAEVIGSASRVAVIVGSDSWMNCFECVERG